MNKIPNFSGLLIISVLSITLLSCSVTLKPTIELPNKWRLPVLNEYMSEWRKSDNERFIKVLQDFNGDKIIDMALLLTSKDGSKLALFAFITDKTKKFQTYKLNEINMSEVIKSVGIRVLAPGTYTTACTKGYWNCNSNEERFVTLKTYGIEYFQIEAGTCVYYWNTLSNNFKQFWISD